jgi:hypothetical protein
MAKSMFIMPFGKFIGMDIEDVEDWYLEYLLDQDWFKKKFPVGFKAAQTEFKYREKFADEKPIDSNWNRR